MPLVLMCGLPCSGKTLRAAQLSEHLAKVHPQTKVDVVCEGSHLDKNAVFGSESLEKNSRAHLRSEVQRTLSKDVVVILDAPNYIKGYRYELYCLSKACKTTHCVVHCDAAVERLWEWNAARNGGDDGDQQRYDRDVFDALVVRFETPDQRNRWDSPLFVVQPEDAMPCQAVCDALFHRKAPPPNQSTQCQPLSSTNFLYELDCTTQEVVSSILRAQQIHGVGDEVAVLADASVKLSLTRLYTPMELARLRRQFIVYTKMHPVEDHQKIATMFVQYLNGGQC